ncbi:MAG TPA: efflux RND transporter periplasmic adaptor subunit [Candidatus Hydrogenedens sp.]|nr:efflux RND transporter periplasmic adaptor subunit [Candidatus Hydrogenedens sp.]
MVKNKKKIHYRLLVIIPLFLFNMSCGKQIVSAEKGSNSEEAFPVKVEAVQKKLFKKTIDVQGTIDSKEHAIVSARIDGVLTDLFVDEGDTVVANETPLFQVDKLKVEQAYEIAKQDLNVAKCAIREADANLANMKAQFDKAQIDYERFQHLLEKKAVSKDTFELQETRYKASKAGLEHAEAVCQLVNEQLKKAEHALKIAEKTLSDSLVYAPISGKISYKFVQKNEFIGGGRPVVKIDNPEVLEVSAFLPAEYYPYIKEKETQLELYVQEEKIDTLTVNYKSPTVLPNLRTFEIKAILDKKDEKIIPGVMAKIEVLLEQRENLGVPKVCVITQGKERYLYKIVDSKSQKVIVNTGFETDGWIEIIEGEINEGDKVVSMGQSFIKDSQTVQVLEER